MPLQEYDRRQQAAADTLRSLFARAGYIRQRSTDKLRALGPAAYKKGAEVRLAVRTFTEARRIQRLLVQVDLKPGKPYARHRHVIQPIYGSDAAEWFGEE